MGTSNWQHIPFCIEVLMKIEPKRVLDVGVGFGRWGIIVREFCDVWFGRVLPEQWLVCIEGIEAFEPNISDYHRYFYNKIYLGDAFEVIPKLDVHYDVVIFGDVIEHFVRQDAEKLLNWSIDHSDYVIVNVPLFDEWPQGDMYGNPYERHKSVWSPSDFEQLCLVRSAIFDDYIGRKHGSFVLSRIDGRGVANRLFSVGTEVTAFTPFNQEGVDKMMQEIINRMRDLVQELEGIKKSRSYQIITRFRRSIPGKIVAKAIPRLEQHLDFGRYVSAVENITSQLKNQTAVWLGAFLINRISSLPSGYTRLKLIGRNVQSQGCEAWILAVKNSCGFLPFDQIKMYGSWNVREGLGFKGRPALVASNYAWVDIPCSDGACVLLLRHPWSGVIEMQTSDGKRRSFDLYAASSDDIVVDLATLDRKPSLPSPHPKKLPESSISWLETLNPNQEFVSVVNPQWRGIYSSTKNLFDNILELPDDLNECTGLEYARLLATANCKVVVIQGFPITYYHLATALRRIAPQTRIAVIWHGTFLQSNEDYVWRSFRQVEQLYRDGVVWKWGFVKARMAEVMANRGIRTGFLQNMVREIPGKPSDPLQGGPHFGIWLLNATNWHKNPLASIAAISMFPSAIIHSSGSNEFIQEYIQFFGIQHAFLRSNPIDQTSIRDHLAKMHLNLYVTLSECAPMLPLESLSVGVPCLIGPTTYYFEDHEYLRERLVVPQPDDAGLIARYISRALEERDDIVNAYIQYAPDYNRRARRLLADFLELSIDE